MKIKKKLFTKWGKINILETSAVGLPVYPAAHKSLNQSLIKALTESEPKGENKLEESPMGEDDAEKSEENSEEKSEESTEEKSEDSESEVTDTEDKPSEPAESEEKSEESSEEKSEEHSSGIQKSFSKKDMVDMMTKGFQAAIKASATPRGLMDNETQVEKMKGVLKEKSLGDLAIMNGMFKAPDMYGRII